jgi:hypothetical protein
MRFGEVPFATDVEQVLDAVEIEEERVAAAAGEKRIGAGANDIRLSSERDSASVTILLPVASGERDCSPLAMNTLKVCRPFCGLENT